jgi:formate dehydrogenase maturation protein FdhE
VHKWSSAVARAAQLATRDHPAGDMLRFYGSLLRTQAEIHDALMQRGRSSITGALADDLPAIRPLLTRLFEIVSAAGPPALADDARVRLDANGDERDLLLRYWRTPSDDQFLAKAFLQPYASALADAGIAPAGRDLPSAVGVCPFCSGRPQLAVLHPMVVGDAAPGRSLQCATCLSSWPFRRVVCAGCGEEREDKLPYFQSAEHEHVRIEACDTCGQYLKGIDLSRLGLAVPLVDEVAAVVLDVWAREHGY